jgi:CRISPR-associated protein Cmr3
MSQYLVKLIPHEKFFFGNERTFGASNEANYLVKSNYFPQQTGILGFIRHQLLLQCLDERIFLNNRIIDKTKAESLIGPKSFTLGNEFNFGKITTISPVFICDTAKTEYYFPTNREYRLVYPNKKDKTNYKYELLQISGLDAHQSPELLKFEPKDGLFDSLSSGNLKHLLYEDVFTECKQVGIRKNYKGITEDDAYYLQTFLKFKNNFCFAFIIDLADDAKLESQPIVIFGGEQQAFKMEIVKDFDKSIEDLLPNYEPSKNADKVVLISDAYVKKDIMNDINCKFAITDLVDFRFLSTTVANTSNYSGLSNGTDGKVAKSVKYQLYKKGSVFYGNASEIEKLFKNNTFQNIGYNFIKIIEKQTT